MLKPQALSLLLVDRRFRLFALAILGLCGCCCAIWSAAFSGSSRALSEAGVRSNLLSQTERAVRLAPTDFQAHYYSALVLSEHGQQQEAIQELEVGVSLRPEDYYLWMELGRARDQATNQAGALEAFREAVRLAPEYAQPRWQLGNLLVRAGDFDQGFAELRRAATSDAKFLPALIDLAWGAKDGDAQAMLKIIQPETLPQRLTLARFLISHDKTAEAINLLGQHWPEISREDQNALVSQLLDAGKYQEAHEAWSAARKLDISDEREAITDGNFESQLSRDEVGFGWQMSQKAKDTSLKLEKNERYAGSRSLRIEFTGEPYPATAPSTLTQLVVVQPGTRYRLRFSARTQDLASGGLPVVLVHKVGGTKQPLVESAALPHDTTDWQTYSVEFTTSSDTRAVTLAIRRQHCTSLPCPIYGRAWFAAFSLHRLTG